MPFSLAGIPDSLITAAERKVRTDHQWRSTCANGERVEWDVWTGSEMGLEDLEHWVSRLVRTGGGFPLRIVVVQLAPTEKIIASGTIWKLGADWDEDETPSTGKRSALVPLGLEDGIDCEEVEATSPFEKFVLLCVERPQIIASIASKAAEVMEPAIDTALAPIVETLIEQVSTKSAEKTAAKVRRILEEMLEFADEPVTSALETTSQANEADTGALDEEEDEQAVMLRRLEQEKQVPMNVDQEIDLCWQQRERDTHIETAESRR